MSRPSIDHIFSAVSQVTGVGRGILRCRSRNPMVVRARALAAAAMRDLREMSYPEIGRELHRSHSSIIELLRQHRMDEDFRRDIWQVADRLNAQRQTPGVEAAA